MSQELELEEGTAKQDSGEARNGTNSGVKNNDIEGLLPRLWLSIVNKHWLLVKKVIDPQGHFGHLISLILCVAAIFVDPVFFYIPVINDDKKCLGLDKKLGIAASVFRSLFDFFYIIYVISKLRTDVFSSSSLTDNCNKIATKCLLNFFLIDLLAVLPLPQVVILIIMPSVRGSKFLDAMKLLKYLVFIQYVPRVIRIYLLYTEAPWNSSNLAEAIWAKAAFNFLLYLLASHGLGTLWYFFSIERETVCWKNACRKHTGCNHGSFHCNDISGNCTTFLNDFCPVKPQNATLFDFGIFRDALESGIVEVTYFPEKLLHCFFWGLQNLSCLGQNLNTSTYSWEDLFAILITISGLMLFILLIGNMQIFLQSKTIRSEDMRLKAREIEEWKPFQKLPENLQKRVKKYQRYIWRETKGADVENLLGSLPKDLRRTIKRELSLELLKKVDEFKKLDGATLDALCDCVKPVFFTEREHIVWEDYLIDEMLFVVQGKIWTYTSKGRGASTSKGGGGACASAKINNHRDNKNKKDRLEDGDFCGQELVAWAMNDPSSFSLPISTRTIQALTKVEAFALMADDLKNVFIKHGIYTSYGFDRKRLKNQAARLIQKEWRQYLTIRKNQAARLIQKEWRRYLTKSNSTRSTREMDLALQFALSFVALFLALQGGRLPNRTPPPPALPQPRAEPEIIDKESVTDSC